LDLVEISKGTIPPVCKIIDYNKFIYDENHKKQKTNKVVLKEIQFKSNIDEHDYRVNINKVITWLDKSYKVKITIFDRTRKGTNNEIAKTLANRIIDELESKYELIASYQQNANRLIAMIDGVKTI
jgi:translation initiation factor IF-3